MAELGRSSSIADPSDESDPSLDSPRRLSDGGVTSTLSNWRSGWRTLRASALDRRGRIPLFPAAAAGVAAVEEVVVTVAGGAVEMVDGAVVLMPGGAVVTTDCCVVEAGGASEDDGRGPCAPD